MKTWGVERHQTDVKPPPASDMNRCLLMMPDDDPMNYFCFDDDD